MTLNAYERETVINLSDGDSLVRIWTAQGTVIRKCRKASAFTEVRSGHDETTEWAEFTIPTAEFVFAVKRRVTLTDEQRQAAAERLAKARTAGTRP